MDDIRGIIGLIGILVDRRLGFLFGALTMAHMGIRRSKAGPLTRGHMLVPSIP